VCSIPKVINQLFLLDAPREQMRMFSKVSCFSDLSPEKKTLNLRRVSSSVSEEVLMFQTELKSANILNLCQEKVRFQILIKFFQDQIT